jgi:protein-L-isoaspartate(D-aspartate) O-methyltransferase
VGPKGHVTAIEVEPELAARARTNLSYLPHVEVIEGDGSELGLAMTDAILVNAGATHPRSSWLDCLCSGGKLLLPLTISNDSDTPQSGQILKCVRQSSGFSAQFICQTVIFPCSGARDPEVNETLKQAFRKGDSKSVRSLRRDQHEPEDTCWLHAESFCLSNSPVLNKGDSEVA